MKKILCAWLLLTSVAFSQGSAPVPPARWWNIGDGLSGDSSNITTTLQATLNRVSKTTGVLVLDSGRYRIDAPIYVPRGVSIVGDKAKFYAFLTNDESAFYLMDSGSSIIGLDIKKIVSGTQSNGEYGACVVVGKYDMNDTLRYPRRNRIENCSFGGDLADGNQVVVFGPTEGLVIDNCTFRPSNSSAHILGHWAADDFSVDTTAGSSVTFHPQLLTITNCFFDTLTGTNAQAIGLSATGNTVVENCKFRKCGMAVKKIPGDYGFIYAGNFLGAGGSYSQNEHLYYANQGGMLTVSNCTGVDLLYGVYEDGRVDTTKTPTSLDSTKYAQPTLVQNCEWYGLNDQTGAGYYLVYTTGFKIEGGAVSLFQYGVRLLEGQIGTIVDNVNVFRNTHQGVYIGAGSDTTVFPNGWKVVNSRIYENYTSVGINNSGYGLHVIGSRDGWIVGNVFGDSVEQYQKWGAFIDGSAGDGYPMRIRMDFNRVKDCNSGSGHAAFRVDDTTDVISFLGNSRPVSEVLVVDADAGALALTQVVTTYNQPVRMTVAVIDSFLRMNNNSWIWSPYNSDSSVAFFPIAKAPGADFELGLIHKNGRLMMAIRSSYENLALGEDTIWLGNDTSLARSAYFAMPSNGDTLTFRKFLGILKIVGDTAVVIQGGVGNPTIADTLVAPRAHIDTIKINGDVVTDLTGTNLSVVGGALTASGSGSGGNSAMKADTGTVVGSGTGSDSNIVRGLSDAAILSIKKTATERVRITAGTQDSLDISLPVQVAIQVGGADIARYTNGGGDSAHIATASGQVLKAGGAGGIFNMYGLYGWPRNIAGQGAIPILDLTGTDSVAWSDTILYLPALNAHKRGNVYLATDSVAYLDPQMRAGINYLFGDSSYAILTTVFDSANVSGVATEKCDMDSVIIWYISSAASAFLDSMRTITPSGANEYASTHGSLVSIGGNATSLTRVAKAFDVNLAAGQGWGVKFVFRYTTVGGKVLVAYVGLKGRRRV